MLSPRTLSSHAAAASSSTGFFDAAAREQQASFFNYQLPLRQDAVNSSDEKSDDLAAHRPSVSRVSSAPEAPSFLPTLFVTSSRNSISRPSVARACSEGSSFDGVLNRRRRLRTSDRDALPKNLILDLAHVPKTIVAGNIDLLQAARRAVNESREFDWQHTAAASPKSRRADTRLRVVMPTTVPSTIPADSAPTKQTHQPKRTIHDTKACIARYWNRPICSYEDEWEWALSGNARATTEAIKGNAYIEKREAVHDIWQQLPDWVSRRSSLGGRDADMSLRGPALHHSMTALKPLTVPEHS